LAFAWESFLTAMFVPEQRSTYLPKRPPEKCTKAFLFCQYSLYHATQQDNPFTHRPNFLIFASPQSTQHVSVLPKIHQPLRGRCRTIVLSHVMEKAHTHPCHAD
ncbi:unnamed protein product, partial [Ectocarpus sp. 12 AP-2014]